MAKVISLDAWLANSYMLDGKRRKITERNIRRAKVKLILSAQSGNNPA